MQRGSTTTESEEEGHERCTSPRSPTRNSSSVRWADTPGDRDPVAQTCAAHVDQHDEQQEARRRQSSPRFRSLPTALVWPNLELMVCAFFLAGLVETSVSVFGGMSRGLRTGND
eukprot:4656594-Prymnesium_polylepis.1